MNAPWKPGSPNGRDPFNAFVCDEGSLDVLRPVMVELGLSPEKCQKGGIRDAVQALSVSASPSILMIDLSESGNPLSDINTLAEVCEPGTIVIALGQVNDVRLYRDLLASGIQDYLLKPLSHAQVRDAVVNAQAILSAPKHGDAGAAKSHICTGVIGTRGGVGASTIATSLAWMFSSDEKLPTALLDLDIHFGTDALTLDLEPGRGLTDAIENPSRIDGLFIERAMIRANDNLAILSAEAPINSPLLTDGAAFVQLEEEFRHAFDMTVVDMPRNMLINFPHVVNDMNVIIIVTELSLAGARDTIRLLSWFKSHAPQAQLIVAANKYQNTHVEITKKDFETSIEAKIGFLLGYDPKAAINAAKLGKPFIEANRNNKTTQSIRELGQAIIAAGSDEEPAQAETSRKQDSGKSKPKASAAPRDAKPKADKPKTSLLSKFAIGRKDKTAAPAAT